MSQQYTNGFDFDVTSGTALCVELPAPPRGMLQRVIVKQLAGGLSGFTFNLLDRSDACAGAAEISDDFEGEDPVTLNKLLDAELHQIVAEVTVAPAAAISSRFDLRAGYQNRDEQDIRRTPNSRIYLDIAALGAGVKPFQIAYTCEPVSMS
jgi:hypothetical protein